MSVKPRGRYTFTAWAIQYRQSKQCVPCSGVAKVRITFIRHHIQASKKGKRK